MSAFSSSRQVTSWLSFKHCLRAVPGKAGGAAVMTTVDHPLMRGFEPHDRWYVAELPRSSGLRRIGDPVDSAREGSPDRGRAPGLAWHSLLKDSLAPPLDGMMWFSRSARRDRHLPGDGPEEARQLAGDRSGDDIGRLAGAGELAVARAQPQLRLPGDRADCPRLRLLAEQQLTAETRRETVAPRRLDQQSTSGAVAGLGQTAAFDAGSARMLGRHHSEISHQLARIGKAREIAQLGN